MKSIQVYIDLRDVYRPRTYPTYQCPSHIFYIINCHAKHETEDLQMDIHPGLGVLATGN